MIKVRKIPEFKNTERFFKFVEKTDTCWNWIGFINDGYGKFNIKDVDGKWKQYFSHRVSWSIHGRKFTDGMVLDHICRNRKCINPDHLREVTPEENVLKNSLSFVSINSEKTKCPSGHLYLGENLRHTKTGARYCLECKRIKKRKYDLRIKNDKT